jgi:hypothetical protein
MKCVRCGSEQSAAIQNLLVTKTITNMVGEPGVIGRQQMQVQMMVTTHQARLCDKCAKDRLAYELLGPVSPEATAQWIAHPETSK